MGFPINFDGGLTCSLPVTALDRSIEWYREVLGFELIYKLDDMGWCELKTCVDGVRLGLSQVESISGGEGIALTFGVKDIETARAKLEAKQIVFDGETQVIPELVKLATFFDPDGNTLMFYEEIS